MKSYFVFRFAYLHLTWDHCQGQGYVHFNCKYLENSYGRNYSCHEIWSLIWTIGWHFYIWPWPTLKVKVKVMQILMINISKMMTDRVNNTIAIKYEVSLGFLLTYLHFTLAHSKRQGHTHDRHGNHCYFQQMGSCIWPFRFSYLDLTLTQSKGKCQGHAHFICKYL